MEDQYGISDLRQYINGRTIFQQPPPDFLSGNSSLSPLVVQHQYPPEINLVGRQMSTPPSGFHHPDFRTDSVATGVSISCGLSSTGACFSGLEIDGGGGGGVGGGFLATGGVGDGGTGRWPRQETLTLLEIRSRLDSKFKEANHKGPLWDEVSRIMSEEHGYQRSGKKCREKFENLYKYYKKTKDGKAGRQDGKHYRFFRQLEALYGETSNIGSSSFSGNHHIGSSSTFPYHIASMAPNNTSTLVSNQEVAALQASKMDDSLSLSNSSDFYSTSSEDVTVENESSDKRRKKKGKKNWKGKIKDFVDSQMRKLMDKQEIWLEKMMRNIEEKEKERIKREEEWKKQEVDRIEREQKYWANERAWIEARDASLMDCLRKITGKEVKPITYPPPQELLVPSTEHDHPSMINDSRGDTRFLESIPSSIIKGDNITEYLTKSLTKKRKDDFRTFGNYLSNDSMSMGNGSYSYADGNNQWLGTLRHGQNEQQHGNSPPPDDGGMGSTTMPYGGYRYLLGDTTGNMWENYGVKYNKGEGENH